MPEDTVTGPVTDPLVTTPETTPLGGQRPQAAQDVAVQIDAREARRAEVLAMLARIRAAVKAEQLLLVGVSDERYCKLRSTLAFLSGQLDAEDVEIRRP